ncbi:MAG: SlyX family protein [Alphaproteobacteria bacterium]|nr:MAG: SlyX family protein [Alphaproteobacteria bacterium]
MSEQRLTDLEIRLAEQDQTLQDLSDMVNRQWQEIELLKRKLTQANDRIVTLEEALPDAAAEKPPHY